MKSPNIACFTATIQNLKCDLNVIDVHHLVAARLLDRSVCVCGSPEGTVSLDHKLKSRVSSHLDHFNKIKQKPDIYNKQSSLGVLIQLQIILSLLQTLCHYLQNMKKIARVCYIYIYVPFFQTR